MRDANRIDKLLDLIKSEWLKNPDLRFMQLIYNLQSSISKNEIGYDLFYLEDNELENYLNSGI